MGPSLTARLHGAARAGAGSRLCGYLNTGLTSVPYFSLISSKIGPTTSGRPIAPDRVKSENGIAFEVSGAFFFLSAGLGQTA